MMPSNGNPDQAGFGMLPSPYSTSYGPAQQYYSGMESAGYPPGANAWPNVSPFAGPPVDSTLYENGFWYNRILQGNRKYYFSADALLSHTKMGPPVLIGAPNVNPVSVDDLQFSAGGTTGGTGGAGTTGVLGFGTTQFNQAIFVTGPSRSIGQGGAGGGGGGNGTTGGSPTIFGSQDTGVLSNIMTSGGFRGTWGWTNSDDSGFEASGFVQGTAVSTWQLNDPQLDINEFSGFYNPLLHLHAWFGLPLGDSGTTSTVTSPGNLANTGTGPIGDTDADGKYGAVQPYDMGVFVRFTSQLMGANADWYFNAIYEQPAIRIRPLIGAKYVHLREKFSFDGYDSGLGYTVSSPSSGGVGGGGNGGGGGTTTGGYLTPLALDTLFSTPNVLHSQLISSDVSNMAGPEAGFRVDLGKKDANFQVWTNTKVGALANVTSRQVSGFNIGNNFNIVSPNTVPAMPNDPYSTAFSNGKTSTTMSPMFEQSVSVKFPIFNLIPYLNRIELFEQAKLQAGYTFLYIGEVYRPQNTIIWNQYPKTPQLNGTTSSFYNSNFNLGVEWQY